MKNILIIGATGFIGKNILESFLTYDNNNIVLLVRDVFKVRTSFKDNTSIKIVQADFKDVALVKKIIENHNINIVIHLASGLIPSSDQKDFDLEMKQIVAPTYELLEYLCEHDIKIIFFSSGGTIYGKVQENKILETHLLQPINYYGYSKLMIENYILFLNRTKNLSYLILRPSNVYGKYQKLDSNQGFIAVSIGKILANIPIEIYGDGNTIRDYINIKDVAIITKELINANINNVVLNIGSGVGTSLNNIIMLLQKYINNNIDIIYKDSRIVDVDMVVLNISKLKSYIDHKSIDLENGIYEFLQNLKNDHA